MCFFLEVLFLMFHLVFMVLHSPLQTLCRCQSPMTSIYHWMYYIILGRKMPLIWIQLFFYESGCLSTSWQDPYLPSFGPHHVALEPLGAWHWCQCVSPHSQRAAQVVARELEHHSVEGCSFQLPQLCLSLHKTFSNKYSFWRIWEKICDVLDIQC